MVIVSKARKKIKLKAGDLVKVISGDSRGKEAKILKIDTKKNRALLEDVNLVVRHKKPTAKNVKGTIVKVPAPINVSNLMFVDTKGTATRLGKKIDESTGKLSRYSKKSGEFIK